MGGSTAPVCKHFNLIVQRNNGYRWVTCTDCLTDFEPTPPPYCDGDECAAQLPDDGEVEGWTVWRNDGERTLLLCLECTTWAWRESGPSGGDA